MRTRANYHSDECPNKAANMEQYELHYILSSLLFDVFPVPVTGLFFTKRPEKKNWRKSARKDKWFANMDKHINT